MRAALHGPTPIPLLLSTSWHIFPLLLSWSCCYSEGGTQLSMCTTAEKSRKGQRKLNQVGLPDNMHHPAHRINNWELLHYLYGTGLCAEQQPAQQGAAPGLRPVGTLLQSCRALEVESITHCTAVISLGAMEEGTQANTEQIHSQGRVCGL